ncbi:MAG: hypothetical protein HW412_1260 [Bacteroidetes bacterium]|nr:hypothetical protein [Bacteroidota bacterium]
MLQASMSPDLHFQGFGGTFAIRSLIISVFPLGLDVKKGIALLFLTLYVYNLAGYYAVFKALQYQVRVEVKTRIKESVPQGKLFLIVVRKGEEDSLRWLEENEFRYRGNMYDIVRQYSRNDTTFYSCVKDKQEELLFENFDLHVATQSNLEGVPMKAATAFKGILKDYVPQSPVIQFFLPEGICIGDTLDSDFASHAADVPTPPPRFA